MEKVEYEPAPEGYYRGFVDEYKFCRAADLPDKDVIKNTSDSFRGQIGSSGDQTHLITESTIPPLDLELVLKQAEKDSMVPGPRDFSRFLPYIGLSVDECNEMNKNSRSFYDLFFKSVANKILYAERFKGVERYHDMAKWINNNFDKFVAFEGDWRLEMFSADESVREKRQNLEKQVFLNAKDLHFSRGINRFLKFFEGKLHPVIQLGSEVPVYTSDETRELLIRFYNCIEGVNEDNFRASFDGQENKDRLNDYGNRFLEHSSDSDPEELVKLANTANILYSSEYSFMYQGAPTDLTLVLPRWVIALEEEFSGGWSGSCHPLLSRPCNAEAYNEEAHYVSFTRC